MITRKLKSVNQKEHTAKPTTIIERKTTNGKIVYPAEVSIIPFSSDLHTFFNNFLKFNGPQKLILSIVPKKSIYAGSYKEIATTEVEITPETIAEINKLGKDKFLELIENLDDIISRKYKEYIKSLEHKYKMIIIDGKSKPFTEQDLAESKDKLYYDYLTKVLKLKIMFIMNAEYSVNLKNMKFRKQQ